jgi:hypothetical protein
MTGIALKGRRFECTSCAHPIETFSLGPGEALNCPGCGDNQVVPETASEVHKPGMTMEVPRPIARRDQAPSRRYPILIFLSTICRLLSVTVLVIGLVLGVLSVVQGELRATILGVTAILSALVACVMMLGSAEGILWMVDVEEHLRALREKDS